MSANSYLVEYLNSAVQSVRDMEDLSDVKESVKTASRNVIAAIQDVQQGLHQNLNIENLRKHFDEAWFQVSNLREEIEKVYTGKPVIY